MRTEEVDDAIDTLQNCIADYVIGDFCVGKYCPMENECKDKDCPFNTAIDKVVAYISELEEKSKKCEYYESVADTLYKDSISKDKIKDKIKEIEENPNNPYQKVMASQIDASLISCLKEILGE